MLPDEGLLPGLPEGSEIHHVAFVSAAAPAPADAVLMEFPDPVGRRAVLIGAGAAAGPKEQSVPVGELHVLSVAADDAEDATLTARVRAWVDRGAAATDAPSQVVTFQGVLIVWGRGRAALVGRADRLDAVRRSLIEAAYYDAELHGVERELGELWPLLEEDADLAFEFGEKSVRRRTQLAQRFKRVIAVRARLARITPHVLRPHVHPPTLASQVSERIRERSRMPHRLEFLGEQIEVFERVYDSCGQRASEFMVARTGHTLEWVIIFLLLAQTLMVGTDLLSSAGK